MSGSPDTIFAATACDSAVVVPVTALMQSLARYSAKTVLLVISVGLTAAEEAFLNQVAARIGLPLRLIPFQAETVQHTVMRSAHVSRAAYARLFLPELLPEHDRVIWLDTDLLVLADLAPLWQMDLRDSLVAAVPDDFIDATEIAATATELGQYFNSGLMVIHLAQWRAEQVMPRVKALMSRQDLQCEDQSVLNMLCVGRVQLLDRKWNFFTRRFLEYPPALRYIAPNILHFGGAPKPWVDRTAFGRLFLHHLPKDLRSLIRAGYPQTALLRRAELARRHVFGLLLGRKKHWLRLSAAIAVWGAETRLAGRLMFQRRVLGKYPFQMPMGTDFLDQGPNHTDPTAQ